MGKRLGWSWRTQTQNRDRNHHSCEINWLNPVPSTESDDYETHMEELQRFVEQNDFEFYRGYYYQPPNEQQYRRLCGEYCENHVAEIINMIRNDIGGS